MKIAKGKKEKVTHQYQMHEVFLTAVGIKFPTKSQKYKQYANSRVFNRCYEVSDVYLLR